MGTIKLKKAGVGVEQETVSAAAESLNVKDAAAATEKQQWDDPAVLKEFADKANETSRHYKLNNGTARSIISATPSNYFDENEQKWKPIDNSLTEKQAAYESNCGKYKTEIAKPENGKSIKMTGSGTAISWEYLGKQNSSAVATLALAEEPVPTTLEIQSEIEGALQSKGSKAVYENADKDTDIEYTLSGNNIKENIVIKEKAEEYRYLFALNTQGLKLRVSDDNESLELYTETVNENGEAVTKTEATIPAPFMYDANGESSDDVYFELVPETDGKYTFAVVADADWINAENRTFPVTIDPQIVTEGSEYITKQVKLRLINTSGSSSWESTSSSYIKVQRSSYLEYMTTLTIKKSSMELLGYQITTVKLKLNPYRVLTRGYCSINNSIVYVTPGMQIETLITSAFKNASGNFTVDVEPYGQYAVDAEFYADGAYGPVIEIEYINNEGKKKTSVQEFTLAGELVGRYDVTTGDASIAFEDVAATDSVLGVGISHVYKKSAEDFHVGKNFRLSLNEKLSKTGAAALDADYVYTDSFGMKHGFKDTYYYIDSQGVKKSISKANVTVEPDGSLYYITGSDKYEVKKEQRTKTGLTVITIKEGFINNKYIDERNQNVIQAEQKLKQLQIQELTNRMQEANNLVEQYKRNNNYYGKLDAYEEIAKKSEQFSKAETEYLFANYPKDEKTKVSLTPALSHENEVYIKTQTITNASRFDAARKVVFNELDGGNYTDEDANENPQIKTAFNYHYSNMLNELKNSMQTIQDNAENQQYFGKTIKDYLFWANQELVKLQNEFLGGADSTTQETPQEVHTQVVQAQHEYEVMKRLVPVNYLTDGKIVKGFNEEGNLVAIFDKYENMMTIEYDEAGKITAVNDGEEKQITFDYRPDGLLGSMTDTRGRRIEYDYDDNGNDTLISVNKADGLVLSLSYDENNPDYLTEVNTSNKMRAVLEYGDDGLLSTVTTQSLTDEIVHGAQSAALTEQGEQSAAATISKCSFSFGDNLTVLTDDKDNKKYYKIDDLGDVYEYYEEENDLVVKAEKYDHVPYEKDNVQYAKKDSLYTKAYSAFTSADFTGGDTLNIELDEFNNPAKKTTNARALSDGTTQEAVITYEYDDDHKCVKETAVVTIKEGTSVLNTYTQITTYSYNASGNVVRKESYVQGEELTTGKRIEETVYDEKGNAVKSFRYNSLDSSSKFYTESEVAENGQTVADYDETGENKTEYEYISGTNVVRSQKLPNGSKFAYGHDENDAVTSITQSTEKGEENSTHTRYTCGEVTELVSGNNVVRYAYDGKRRVSGVTLNGAEYVTIETADATETTDETVRIDYIARGSDNKSDRYEVTKNKRGDIVGVKYAYAEKTASPTYAELYTNEYDIKNRVVQITQGTATLESNEYDEYDRQTKHTFGAHVHVTEYNGYGQTSKEIITFGNDAEDKQEYVYTYDSEKASRPQAGMTVGGFGESYEQDASGRSVKLTQTLGGNTYTKRYGYYKQGDHATNRVNTICYGKNGVTDGKVTYTYDGMGNIVSVNENGKQRYKYTYDKLNRIISEKDLYKNKEVCYTYDSNGNILTKSIGGEVTEYRYKEGSDRLVSFGTESIVYDNMGNPTTYRGMACTWEKGRQLASITDGTNKIEYEYDVFGLRKAKKIYEPATAQSPTETTSYIYENGKLLRQVTGGEVMDFYYGSEGVIGFKLSGSSVSSENGNYLYRKNLFGDIIGIIDESGALVYEYAYSAFGKSDKEVETGIGAKNPFRYRGYYYDTETGLYYLKSRYYDPEVGRFITIDDTSYLDPDTINGLNLYAYCGNNPVMRVDENGNSWWDNLWKVIVGVVVIGALVAGSVLTAGTLSVVLAGAAIGAIGGALGSVVSTAVTGDWGNFGNNFLVGIGAGAISGAISATGLGIGWQIGANALIGLGNYAVSTKINGGKITIGGLISSAVFGGFAGAIGGAGMMNGNSLANAFVGFNGKNFFATLGANVGKELFKSLLKQSVSYIIIGGLLNGLYSRFLQNKFNPKNNFWGW